MIQFKDKEHFPQTLDDAVILLKSFWIPIEITESGGQWLIWEGTQLSVACGSQEEATIYVLGKASAFADLPPEVIQDVKNSLGPYYPGIV